MCLAVGDAVDARELTLPKILGSRALGVIAESLRCTGGGAQAQRQRAALLRGERIDKAQQPALIPDEPVLVALPDGRKIAVAKQNFIFAVAHPAAVRKFPVRLEEAPVVLIAVKMRVAVHLHADEVILSAGARQERKLIGIRSVRPIRHGELQEAARDARAGAAKRLHVDANVLRFIAQRVQRQTVLARDGLHRLKIRADQLLTEQELDACGAIAAGLFHNRTAQQLHIRPERVEVFRKRSVQIALRRERAAPVLFGVDVQHRYSFLCTCKVTADQITCGYQRIF